MENKNNGYFNKIKKMFSLFSFSYDIGLALSGFSENSKIRNESIKSLNLNKGDVVFDLCCGTGLNFNIIKNNIGINGRIIGVDMTQKMLEIAKIRCIKKNWINVDLLNANILEFKTDIKGDGAICALAMGMIPEYNEAIDFIMKYLKVNGRFTIIDVKKSDRFPYKMANSLFTYFAKTANFNIKDRNLVGYIKSKYEVTYYKELFGGFGYIITFNSNLINKQ